MQLPTGDILDLTAAEICACLQSSFDWRFYSERYPDVARDQVDALQHYALVGWKQGRDPCDWFSTESYLADHADVSQKGVNPLLHYVLYGRREGRAIWPAARMAAIHGTPSRHAGDIASLGNADILRYLRPAFDSRFYTERYRDMATGLVDPLEHYAFFGWKEDRDPCSWFSTKRYLAQYADVAQSRVNPLLHYVLSGQHEGRHIWPADFSGSLELAVDRAATFVTDPNLQALTRFPPRALCPPRSRLRPDRLVIHWLVPDFSPGSGGHMTIFRIVRWLEIMGHECTIWITGFDQHRDSRDAYDDIIKHFQTIRARVAGVDDGFASAQGDLVVATGWQTVARAMHATHFRDRCYFVQDYEVNFHPMGSSAVVARWTYTQGLACICASPWLADMLKHRFGSWTRHFYLAYDRDIYFPASPKRQVRRNTGSHPRIAVYARMNTARRAVELVFLALEHLAAEKIKFHVDLFGDDHCSTRAPFPCTSHGILDAAELADLYRNADIGICFSTTNYSLIPQEMMACGLPVVEIDCESTRAVFPKGVVTITGPHPLTIAADIAKLLHDGPRRRRQSAAALQWVSQFDWEKSARTVEHALLERLAPHRLPQVDSFRKSAAVPPPKVTVCIPTYNGGQLLLRVVDRVRSQRTPWPFEIVIVDSSSADGSIQRLASTRDDGQPRLRIKQIPQCQFQHGRTRNLCAGMANGEYVAFLTQDALPTDGFWLYNLVTVLDHFPRAAGAFGRHVAWPTASPFTKRDISAHFSGLARHPLVLSRETDAGLWQSGDEAWRRVLHYFSDNNSCLRRSVWQRVPYPELDYGEDQVWADSVIRLGYEKAYVPSATVYHSHDHTPEQAADRAATEARFFAGLFGYRTYDWTRSFEEQLAAMQETDTRWAAINGASGQELKRQLALNEAKLSGRARGMELAGLQDGRAEKR